MEIKECTAVVTGGASGLGEASVRSLSALGARVAIFDIAVERGEKLAAELGPNCIFEGHQLVLHLVVAHRVLVLPVRNASLSADVRRNRIPGPRSASRG